MHRRSFIKLASAAGAGTLLPSLITAECVPAPVPANGACHLTLAASPPKLWSAADLGDDVESTPVPPDPIWSPQAQAAGSWSRVNANRFRVEAVGFDYAESEQVDADGCWAAVVQSILAYNGITISQREIVRAVQGTHKVGMGASLGDVMCALNGALPDLRGRPAFIRATPFVDSISVLRSLAASQPVLVGRKESGGFGHVCALAAAEYSYWPRTFRLQRVVVPNLHEVELFDPLPHHGDETVDADAFIDGLLFAMVVEVTHA